MYGIVGRYSQFEDKKRDSKAKTPSLNASILAFSFIYTCYLNSEKYYSTLDHQDY